MSLARVLLVLLAILAPAVQADPPALAGPSVEAPIQARSTLVRWDYAGRLVLLDSSAEEAAIALLELTREQKERVLEIVAERAAIFDKVIITSIDLFQRFESADESKNGAQMLDLLGQFTERLGPLTRRGSLFDEVYSVLPREQAMRFARLVDEYHWALLRDARRAAELENRSFDAVQAALQIRGQEMLRAIERSLERSTVAGEREFEELLEKLDLKPESEQTIRAMATDFAARTNLNPTKAQTLVFVVQVLAELEPGERAKVVRKIIEINREDRRAARQAEERLRESGDTMSDEPMPDDEPMADSGG
ncbi:MAG: hypothetical protein DYG94_08610 [Leptolyngbya sp. PLA3]|nr:MAG: hypothetical protein EDM82_07220 [Cyanobacteria bacterium CYA]MCE7968792.1 hypothetical protein [Leptolyngbya sp. PL-A3]